MEGGGGREEGGVGRRSEEEEEEEESEMVLHRWPSHYHKVAVNTWLQSDICMEQQLTNRLDQAARTATSGPGPGTQCLVNIGFL